MLGLKIRRLRVGMEYLLICSTFSEGRKEEEEVSKEGTRGARIGKGDFHFLWVYCVFWRVSIYFW